MPDANVDARLRSIKTAAVPAAPDDHGIRRRKRVIPARSRGLAAAQRRTCGLLKRLVGGLPPARLRLCSGQLRNHRQQPSNASPARRRDPSQLVVVATADKLNPAFPAIPQAASVLPHCSAADAGRDRQAARLLHLVNITRCDLSFVSVVLLAQGQGVFQNRPAETSTSGYVEVRWCSWWLSLS